MSVIFQKGALVFDGTAAGILVIYPMHPKSNKYELGRESFSQNIYRAGACRRGQTERQPRTSKAGGHPKSEIAKN